jgi:hypothetical protein
MGAAIGFITSEPTPVLHMLGTQTGDDHRHGHQLGTIRLVRYGRRTAEPTEVDASGHKTKAATATPLTIKRWMQLGRTPRPTPEGHRSGHSARRELKPAPRKLLIGLARRTGRFPHLVDSRSGVNYSLSPLLRPPVPIRGLCESSLPTPSPPALVGGASHGHPTRQLRSAAGAESACQLRCPAARIWLWY